RFVEPPVNAKQPTQIHQWQGIAARACERTPQQLERALMLATLLGDPSQDLQRDRVVRVLGDNGRRDLLSPSRVAFGVALLRPLQRVGELHVDGGAAL